mgnify:CR=1 FL=1
MIQNSSAKPDRIDLSKLSVVVGQLGGAVPEVKRQLDILGIEAPRILNDYESICRSIESDKPDLLLCSMTPGQKRANELLRGIRHQDIGANPFLVTLSLADPMGPAETAQTINTGIDIMLVAPFLRDAFVLRVNDLAFHRKKFVAIPQYVGPTRRVSTRSEDGLGEEFEVPNPVHAAGTGIPRETLLKQISAAAQDLDARKMSNDVLSIRRLVYEIIPDYQAGDITDRFRERVSDLYTTIGLLRVRAKRLGYLDVVSMCDIAGDVIGEIREQPVPPNLKRLRAMPKLVTGFHTALHTTPAHHGAAH